MKKLVVAVALFVGLTTVAQEKKMEVPRRENKEKMTPEQREEFQLKKLTKELGLNEKQTQQVKDLMEKGKAEREAKKAEMQKRRASGDKPTAEEREAMRTNMQAKQEQMKGEMKKILTPEQYTKWEAKFEERKEKLLERREEKRGGRKGGNVEPQK